VKDGAFSASLHESRLPLLLEGAMRVLVVEDDLRLARMLQRLLQEERYVVDLVADGVEAEERIRGAPYDAVILDVVLPRRDGMSVCRNLRDDGIAVPVLMLTARDTVSDRVRGLDAGADDYLVKPFASAELLARLRSLARRRTPELQPAALELDGLRLDPVRHEVMREGRVIDLTPREFALLEYLLRHPGQVLSRTQILNSVWQYDAEVTSNIVDSYIHFLRDKVDRPFGHRLLHTVRGVGYALRA
jgi:two-component system, OmpR family, response regulator